MKTLALLVGCLLFTVPAWATIYYVKTTGNDSNDGQSWGTAFQTLQKALTTVSSGDQIWVAAGTYYPTDYAPGETNRTDPRLKAFTMRNGVAIYGGFPASGTPSLTDRDWIANPTILSGDVDQNDGPDFSNTASNTYHVFYHYYNSDQVNSTAILDGFTITGANANSTTFNDLAQGAGMYNAFSSPTVINCTFIRNQAVWGGGIYNFGASSPTVINCAFLGNKTRNGGGGMYNWEASTTITNCVFSGNMGVALINQYSNSVLTNCTFSGNNGAIYNLTGSPVIRNSILWGNGTEVRNESSSAPAYTNTIVQGGSEPGVINEDPLFISQPNSASAPTTQGDLRLRSCSPAINRGDNSFYSAGQSLSLITTDLDNQPRFYNSGTVDLGAYEFQSNTTTVKLGFTAQPVAGSVVCVGATVTASVSVSGTGPVSYVWYRNGQVLSPAQSTSILSLSSVTTANSGTYVVEATGACNSATSTAFSLTVDAVMVSISASNTVLTCISPSLTLTASTSATGLLWSNGRTGSPLSVSTTGMYSVTATTVNGCTVVSNTLTIGQDLSMPNFMIPSQTVCQGQVVSLQASGCSGGVVRWSTGTTGTVLNLTGGNSTSVLTATCTIGICSTLASSSVVIAGLQPPPAQILSLRADESACPVRLVGQGVGTGFVFTGPQSYVFSNVYRLGETHSTFADGIKQPGIYTMTATYTNACGVSVPVSQTVTVSRSCP